MVKKTVGKNVASITIYEDNDVIINGECSTLYVK